MHSVREWGYIPITLFLNFIFLMFWHRKNGKPNTLVFVSWIFISLIEIIGIDIIQRQFEVYRYFSALKVSLGCWLCFAFPSYLNHSILKSNFKEKFKNDFKQKVLGEIISFLLIGTLIYHLT